MAGPSAPQEPGETPVSGADDALDARLGSLTQALDRRKEDDAQAAELRKAPSSTGAMALGMRAMSDLVAAVVVGAGLGWGLDHLVGSDPWGLIVGLGLGAAAGFLGVYRLAAGTTTGPTDGSAGSAEE
jgi:ATP synthase protein I